MRRDLVASQPLRSVWDTVDGVSIHARVSTRELDQDRIRSGNPKHALSLAELVVLDEAAHALPYDDPAIFAALILDLLQVVEATV